MSKFKNFDDFEDSNEPFQAPDVKEGHKDYEKNLEEANNFIKRFDSRCLPGMKIYIGDGQWTEKAVLFLCFTPKYYIQCGNYSHPVNLHQSNKDFKKECLGAFNAIYQKALKNQ